MVGVTNEMESNVPELPESPTTGHEGVDAALAALELGADVNAHPAKLAEALDVLAQALAATDDPSGS